MIEVKDRFYLVDGGPARGTTRLNKYLNNHVPKKNGKIEIQVAIITHNHTDHYRGIEYILNNTDTYRAKKVLKSSISPEDDINTACNKSKNKNGTIVQTLKVGEIVPLAKYNDAQVTVYSPSDTFVMLRDKIARERIIYPWLLK